MNEIDIELEIMEAIEEFENSPGNIFAQKVIAYLNRYPFMWHTDDCLMLPIVESTMNAIVNAYAEEDIESVLYFKSKSYHQTKGCTCIGSQKYEATSSLINQGSLPNREYFKTLFPNEVMWKIPETIDGSTDGETIYNLLCVDRKLKAIDIIPLITEKDLKVLKGELK